LRNAFDPLLLHFLEIVVARRGHKNALSFGESLDSTRDILLVAACELTDLLAVVPAAKALKNRFPLARVHVLADGACAEVLAARPEVFEVIRWDPATPVLARPSLDIVRHLRGRPFDLAIVLDSGEARRQRVLAALSGARLRLGMHPSGADPTLNLVVATPVSTGYRPAQSLDFLTFLGIAREALTPGWATSDQDRTYAERLLSLRRGGRECPLVGIDPGAGRCGVRPSTAKLAWLADTLAARRGAEMIILSDIGNEDYVRELKSVMKCAPLEVPSRGTRDLLAFTSCCDLFVAGNTSLFHLAVAQGVASVGLFGAEDGERWEPREMSHTRILRLQPGERVVAEEFVRLADALMEPVGEQPLELPLARPRALWRRQRREEARRTRADSA
jgi:ADP-heptose:LPS heptosyltransferase